MPSCPVLLSKVPTSPSGSLAKPQMATVRPFSMRPFHSSSTMTISSLGSAAKAKAAGRSVAAFHWSARRRSLQM
eukprot:10468205-Alexandrium_andersonii.AAC.1